MMTKQSFLRAFALLLIGCASISACKKGKPPVVPDNPTPNNEENKPDKPADVVLDHLIFEEVYFNGVKSSNRLSKFTSDYDHYIKVTNPSKETKYLDGLGLLFGILDPTEKMTFEKETENHIATHVGVKHLVQLPGTGKDFPIEPGKSRILAYAAIDHGTNRQFPQGMDLSNADIEIMTDDQIKSDIWYHIDPITEEDLPPTKKPNCTTIYGGVFTMKSGKGVLALVEFKAPVADLTNPEYKWDATWYADANMHDHGHGQTPLSCLRIPNDWVIDAVVLSPNGEKKWDVVASTVDAGFKGVVEKDLTQEKLSQSGKAIFRKHDGKGLVDTNNSTLDFEVKDASLLKKS